MGVRFLITEKPTTLWVTNDIFAHCVCCCENCMRNIFGCSKQGHVKPCEDVPSKVCASFRRKKRKLQPRIKKKQASEKRKALDMIKILQKKKLKLTHDIVSETDKIDKEREELKKVLCYLFVRLLFDDFFFTYYVIFVNIFINIYIFL